MLISLAPIAAEATSGASTPLDTTRDFVGPEPGRHPDVQSSNPTSTVESAIPEPWTAAEAASGTLLRTIPAAPWYGSRRVVALRRRVDWALILGSDTPEPAMLESHAPEELGSLIAAFDELLRTDDVDSMLRGAVEIALQRIGLKR